MTMRDSFTETVAGMADDGDRIAVITADIGAARFEMLRAQFPGQVVNVGIREQAMIGVAAGFALEGFTPIVHSYAPFLVERAFEQIKLDLVHQGVGAVLVSIGGSFDSAREGRTHQAPGDVAVLATLPDVDLHVPGHPHEVAQLIRHAVKRSGTSYIRLSEAMNRRAFPADGRVHAVKVGTRSAPTVLAIGPTLEPVLDATEDMDVTVLVTSTVRPIDSEGLRQRTGTHLVVVEPYLEGTTVPILLGALAGSDTRVTAVGVPGSEVRRYGTWQQHRAALGLDANGIRERLAVVAVDGEAALGRHAVWLG